jgi:D-arabinose 5-phosphate isomerase GutQ
MSSTGTAATFLHPAEALHGDLGLVQHGDVVIALSSSGETEELVRLLEANRRIGAKLIFADRVIRSRRWDNASERDAQLSCGRRGCR